MGMIDYDIMIFEDDKKGSHKKGHPSLEFKDAVKFLRQHLHSLNLDF